MTRPKPELKKLSELADDCEEGDLILLVNPEREKGLPVYLGFMDVNELVLYQDEVWRTELIFDRKTNCLITAPYHKRGYTHYEVLKRERRKK